MRAWTASTLARAAVGSSGTSADGLARQLGRVVLGLGQREGAGEHAEQLAAHGVGGVGRQVVELLADHAEGAGRVAGRDQGVGDEPDERGEVEVGCRRATGCRASSSSACR